MENQVINTLKIKRASVLNETSKLITEKFLQELVGTTQKVLFETEDGNNTYSGHTENYIKVKVKSNEDIKGRILSVIIKTIRNGEAFAEVVSQ